MTHVNYLVPLQSGFASGFGGTTVSGIHNSDG